MEQEKTNFKHFTSLGNILNILKTAYQSKKFTGGYWWVNSLVDIGAIQPKTFQIFMTCLDPSVKHETYPMKWCKEMMEWPFMRIDITHNCVAHGCNGFPGMVGTDGISISYFKGMDLSKYDESIDNWDHKSEYIKADIDKRFDSIKRFEPENCYEFEETLYNCMNNGTILEPVKELWYSFKNLDKVNSIFEEGINDKSNGTEN